jgi:Flp pilus assembly protein TadG
MKLRNLLRGNAGSSLVESALVLSFFCVPFLVATGEMGLIIWDSIEVQNSAHTAASYAMQSPTMAANTSAITTAAQADAPTFGADLAVTPTVYYVCSAAIAGTQYTGSNAASNASAACTGGSNHPLQFVKVATSVTVTPALHWTGLTRTFGLSGSSAIEVEQ